MKNSQVYLFFSGHCEEALHFYQGCFDGEITRLSRFKEGNLPNVPAHYEDKIMHAEFTSKYIDFMASDGQIDQTIVGNNIQLSLGFDSTEEQAAVFKKLVQGGDITMPLEDTFWGARFGMLKDKFGIHWMLNCELKK